MAAQPLPVVDWEAVKEELEAIDDSWKQPRFDSLTHVVEVLTSHNPEDATQTLREQRDAIEALVDDVVRGYHKGFNKAIHNYSQILRLFSESATGLSGLKLQLADCKKLLGARHKQLQQQWYRSVILRNVISLLDQIDNVSKVPAKIEQYISEKRYYSAVQLHIQSISMLEREGIQGVGALQDVRAEFSNMKGVLFFKVVEDLHSHLYGKGEYSTSVIRDKNADDDLLNIDTMVLPAGSSHPFSRRTRAFKKSENGGDGSANGHVEDRRNSSDKSSISADSKDEELSQDESVGKESMKPKRATLVWLGDATPNEFVEAITKSDATLNVKYLQTMVECLNLLGKTAAAGALISQRLRQTVHDLIIEEIKAHAVAVDASRPRVGVSKISVSHKNGVLTLGLKKVQDSKHAKKVRASSEALTSIGPTGPGQTAARNLVEPVLAMLARVLANHVIVGKAMESHTGDDDTHSVSGYNIGFAVTVIQSECQQFICDILRANADAAQTDSSGQAARQSKVTAADKSNAGPDEGLSFTFRFTDAMSLPGAVPRPVRRRGSANAQEGFGVSTVLSDRGMYLIASLYRPVLEFTDGFTSLLPEKYASLGKEGLHNFLETFIKDQFLPRIYVDYRTRAADALASSAAFRLKTRSSVTKMSSIALLGPSVADQLASEVVAWAHAMPKYAPEFLELVQTILERTLERCRAAYTEAVLGSLSSSIIGRTDVEQLMQQDPASVLLEANCPDHYPNGEDVELEMEMNNLLLSLRPIKHDQLIHGDQKFVLLAALSESLSSLATSIQNLGSQQKKNDMASKRPSNILPSGLHSLIAKYQDLSSECLRTLRIEMQLQAIHYLQSMTGRVYVSDHDAEEPEDFIVSFTSQITRWDEEMTFYISSAKRNYAFGGICGVAATAFVKALNDMSLVNVFGVRQICRNCIALQQALAALSSTDADMVQQRLDRVRTYYELLTMPFEALIAFVNEHDSEFSFTEVSNLLKVNVPGREIPPDAVQRIGKVLAP
ncbi:exocyst complex component SEC8 [Selaginella moellendorffii]|uniref:exocyst complex component SEC8 n=1 Tax=Selaginella moellendorffii TaxID=88036 RepID=UPI000D1C760C|nr:exocyst complex component SEC8 [Selaginella moellendorffii]|eukprot:XP_024537637.1 exocyst complex component SEC8 [Selaginella moellendorffii]